jgi:hypothetical protein
MNIILKRLFYKYKIWKKDRYEITSIFNFLNSEKKQKLIDNFEKIYSDIKVLNEENF